MTMLAISLLMYSIYPLLTGQFADKPSRGQSSRGVVNSTKRLI